MIVLENINTKAIYGIHNLLLILSFNLLYMNIYNIYQGFQ